MPEPGTPDGDQPTDARADEAAAEGTAAEATAADEATADATRAGVPRASGSAVVPPSAPKRKWLDDESAVTPPPPPPPPAVKRDPTLELPLGERFDAESLEPVDPWADADPLTPLPPAVGYPPTRPYETAPPPDSPPPVGTQTPPPPDGTQLPAVGPGSPPAAWPGSPPAAWPASPAGAWPASPGVPGVGAVSPGGPPTALPPGTGPMAPHPVRTRRPAKQPKVRKGGPVAPPGWRPPPGYVAVPVRRRRKWPWVLLLSVLCCCGVPGYFAQPYWEQYPVSATTPATIADLSLRQDDASERTANRLRAATRTEYALAESTFAAIYGDGRGKRVTVFGATGLHFDLDGDVTHEIGRLTDRYGLTEIQSVPGDGRGEQRRCGVGEDDGKGVVVCSWADHGSVGSGVFTRLSVEDSSRLLSTVRNSILTRG